MVKRLRRCPLTAESAVRFRMGLPKKREANTSGVGFAFFVAPERNLRGNLLPSFVLFPRQRILPRDSRLRETANSANDYKQKAFEIYAATCCRRSYSRQRILPRDSRLRETANSANDYKQKVFGVRAATCFVVRQFAARQFFTKEHNSSAFLWIIRLTFPKSYYIIET